MSLTASDMAAMRRALEAIDPVDIARKPAEFRHVFAPAEATVRLALEIVLQGGVAYLPANPPHAWIALWGWAIEGHPRAGAEMRVTRQLVDEFNRQREARGR